MIVLPILRFKIKHVGVPADVLKELTVADPVGADDVDVVSPNIS